MQGQGGGPLAVNILVNPFHLNSFQSHDRGSLRGRDAMVLGPHQKIHLGIGQHEVKLVLALLQTVGVGGGSAAANLVGQAEMPGHGIDLGLVEVGDGLHSGGTVAVLDEEALVVLEAVGSAGHGEVEAVGVVVLSVLRMRCLKLVAATISK